MKTVETKYDLNECMMNIFLRMQKIANQDIALAGYLGWIMTGIIPDQELSEMTVVVPSYIDFSKIGRVTYNDWNNVCKVKTVNNIEITVVIDPSAKSGFFDFNIGANLYHKVRVSHNL